MQTTPYCDIIIRTNTRVHKQRYTLHYIFNVTLYIGFWVRLYETFQKKLIGSLGFGIYSLAIGLHTSGHLLKMREMICALI